MNLFCPACTKHFNLPIGEVRGKCPNRGCHVPYEFRIFDAEDAASSFYINTSSWKTKYLFCPRDAPDRYVVAYFNDHIRPFSIHSVSSLVGEEILRALQAGAADHIGGPITLMEIYTSGDGGQELRRVEPLEYASASETPAHMRRFVEFCRRLRMAETDMVSGDALCKAFDHDAVSRYISQPPYRPSWHHCWAGLVDYIVPVIVHGTITGVLLSGQRRTPGVQADRLLAERVGKASHTLRLRPDLMLPLALADDVKLVEESDIERDLAALQNAAHFIEQAAAEKYGAECQVAESHFLEEVDSRLAEVAGSQIASEDDLWSQTEPVLQRILDFVQCFVSIALLAERPRGSNSFRVVAGQGPLKREFVGEIPQPSFDELMPDRLGPLLVDGTARPELYRCLSQKLVPYHIHTAYVIRISLRSARQLLLVLASPQHECRFVAVEGFCHQRSGLGRRFLAQLGVTLTREFDELVSIQHLLAEEGRRSAFLTRAAHSLSLPIQSIIADSANLLDDLDPSGPSYEAAVHNFREVQGLRLVTENLLHGAEEETDQPEPEYRLGSLLSPLREACEMFMGEASDKGCDIRPVVCLGDIEEPLLPTELDNLWLLYVRGFYQLLKRKARMPRRMTLHPADISCTMEVAGKETSVPVQNAAERCFRLLANGSATAKAARARIAMGDRSAWFPASTLAEMYLPGAQMVRDELALALQNILHNAVKYSYRTVPRSKKRYIDVRCEAREGKYCTVSVSNYGIGIEQYEIDEGLIWKPRYRGRRSRDRNRTGSGLGLSHARRAVERIHGGRIEARSVRQPGGAYVTTLVVTLPMTQAYRMDKETRDAQDEVATR